jgi:hypothetical protein
MEASPKLAKPKSLAPLPKSDSGRKQTKSPDRRQSPPVPDELQGYKPPEDSAQARAIAAALAAHALPAKTVVARDLPAAAPKPAPKPSPNPSPTNTAGKYQTNVTEVEVAPAQTREAQFHGPTSPSHGRRAAGDDYTVTIHSDPNAIRTASGLIVPEDYAIHFYPRMKTATHMENYFGQCDAVQPRCQSWTELVERCYAIA